MTSDTAAAKITWDAMTQMLHSNMLTAAHWDLTLSENAVRCRATHVAIYQCQAFDSSRMGQCSTLMLGPTCSFQLETAPKCVGQTPSQFRYLVGYCDVKPDVAQTANTFRRLVRSNARHIGLWLYIDRKYPATRVSSKTLTRSELRDQPGLDDGLALYHTWRSLHLYDALNAAVRRRALSKRNVLRFATWAAGQPDLTDIQLALKEHLRSSKLPT